MKKHTPHNFYYLMTLILKVVLVIGVVNWLSPLSIPGLTTLNIFNLPKSVLYNAVIVFNVLLPILVVANIIWARKRNSYLLLLTSPIVILLFQVVLMTFFSRDPYPITETNFFYGLEL